MERLRQSDLQRLLAFTQDCYAIREFEPFQEFILRLVAALPRLIPAAHVTYNEMYPEKSESYNCVSTAELNIAKMDRLWELHMHEQPVLTHIVQTKKRQALRISDFWNQRQMHDSGLHHDFYRLCNIEDALCISVPCPLPRVIGIAWHNDRSFTDRERLIAELVSPHISQAWRNAKLLSHIHSQMQMLQASLESLGTGVIVCGPHGRVQFINAQARRHLAQYFGTTRQLDRCLPENLLLWARGQDLRLRKNDDAPPVRTSLVIEKENKHLVVSLLSRPGANLILMEEERTLPETIVTKTLGLTAREAEVLNWIACGKTNQEIAIILEMHTATVKKHVEHILLKLGVENRTAAASLVLEANPHRTVH